MKHGQEHTVGEMGVSWHVFQKNAHKMQKSLNFRNEWCSSEKVDIYIIYQFKV